MLKALFRHADPRGYLPTVVSRYIRTQVGAIMRGRLPLRIPRLCGEMRVRPDMHMHAVPELFLQVSGATAFEFPHEGFRLLPGEICVVPRGMPHFETPLAYRGPFHNFVFRCEPGFLMFHLAYVKAGRPKPLYGHYIDCPAQRQADYLDDTIETFHAGGPLRQRRVRHLLAAHLTWLLIVLEGKRVPTTPEAMKVIQASHYVMSHLDEHDLHVPACGRVGLVQRQLSFALVPEEDGTGTGRFHKQAANRTGQVSP